jgi:hypothetical protein
MHLFSLYSIMVMWCTSTLVVATRKGFRALRILFRIINEFVHRFILDRTFVDFEVSLLILPFYIVDFNSETVKLTMKNGKINNHNRKINGFMV